MCVDTCIPLEDNAAPWRRPPHAPETRGNMLGRTDIGARQSTRVWVGPPEERASDRGRPLQAIKWASLCKSRTCAGADSPAQKLTSLRVAEQVEKAP